MIEPDFRGARASNAGDDFHELWALRQALALLDSASSLQVVTVEGLQALDEKGAPVGTWDGVDCAFYYGGDTYESVCRLTVDQLKYSPSDPDKIWTVARLTQASNKRGTNAVIKRLADAFVGLHRRRPDLALGRDLVIRLVSNQPVDQTVVDALSRRPEAAKDRALLIKASGLDQATFEAFSQALDLSNCGRGSRFDLEERIVLALSDLTGEDASADRNQMLRLLRSRMMMPEGRGEAITRAMLLSWLGVSDPAALFPCPPVLKPVTNSVPRQAAREIAERMATGEARLCLAGEGGCGKTTMLQEIKDLLPPGSLLIVYDCYGAGRYLDADAHRHRPADAFVQLTNDLARTLRTPLLVSGRRNRDHARLFARRLADAAALVEAHEPAGLLVIAVDAADNAVTAAQTRVPPEACFVHDFVGLGELPANVRFLVTARPGRLDLLQLPRSFAPVLLEGFTPTETAEHARRHWPEAPDSWVADLHHLSAGNPRVQAYALERAGTLVRDALDHLRPKGKSLGAIFTESISEALRKAGRRDDLAALCAGLVALPRPVPLAHLATATTLPELACRDLCLDLAPGLRIQDAMVGFADEDFETFVRKEAEPALTMVQAQVAEHLAARRNQDDYAAAHVASCLYAAGRRAEIVALVKEEREPTAIQDPVLRRAVQVERLRIAMRVCRETGSTVDAALTVLIGAEALKTDAAIRRILIENPDLAARFAPDTAARLILRDSEALAHHGPFLFHLMAEDARRGNLVGVREGRRTANAWLRRRDEIAKARRRRRRYEEGVPWDIGNHDFAAGAEALLRTEEPNYVVRRVRSWKHRDPGGLFEITYDLLHQVVAGGNADLIESYLRAEAVPPPLDFVPLTFLALAGRKIDIQRLMRSLSGLARRGWLNPSRIWATSDQDHVGDVFAELALTGCEIVIAHGGDATAVTGALQALSRAIKGQMSSPSSVTAAHLSIALRAFALLERVCGRTFDVAALLGQETTLDTSEVSRRDSHDRQLAEDRRNLRQFAGSFGSFFDRRAQVLLGLVPTAEIETALDAPAGHAFDGMSRRAGQMRGPLRTYAALAITRLLSLPGADPAAVLRKTLATINPEDLSPLSDETGLLAALALAPALHEPLLAEATHRATAVKAMRIGADDKIGTLLRLARFLAPISPEDAKVLFADAISAADEIDESIIHSLALFTPLVRRGLPIMGADMRREIACKIAATAGDAAVRLSHGEFLWDDIATTLAALDPAVGWAAMARWEDGDLIGRRQLLSVLIRTGLEHGSLSPGQAAALLPLREWAADDDIIAISAASGPVPAVVREALADELAHAEALHFGRGKSPAVLGALEGLAGGGNSPWLAELSALTEFHLAHPNTRETDPTHDREAHDSGLGSVTCTSDCLTNAVRLDAFVSETRARLRGDGGFVSVLQILDHVATQVPLRERRAHLEALTQAGLPPDADQQWAEAIRARVREWAPTLAVKAWCRERLLSVAADMLPAFTRSISWDPTAFPEVLNATEATPSEIVATLLEGLERHAGALGLQVLFGLVRLIMAYAPPEDAVRLAQLYAERLDGRVPREDHNRDPWDPADLPISSEGGLARLLYALLSDVELAIRWRAAHAVRNLARLNEAGVLRELVALYGRTEERSYRDPDAPFYCFAARLWLVIALDRAAAESPATIAQHGPAILRIATDPVFPHLLVRAYAASAVHHLVAAGVMKLSREDGATLQAATTSPLPRAEDHNASRFSFGHGGDKRPTRRFTFDSMDTLPYWYSPALQLFAHLEMQELLDAAERWIVDRWGVRDDPFAWVKEPRQARLSDQSLSTLHRHGSLPQVERYTTYLEWHALHCALGGLLATHALVQASDWGSFEKWLAQNGLTAPPLWLADLHGPKPTETELWHTPRDLDAWAADVSDNEALAAVGLGGSGPLVVGAWHSTGFRPYTAEVVVNSALVSPETAGALLRALQTARNSNDYRVPAEDDDLEIDAFPYRLIGWLADGGHASGIDEGDPLTYGCQDLRNSPGRYATQTLDLTRSQETGRTVWRRGGSGAVAFIYRTWSDTPGNTDENRLRYDHGVRSSGWRLTAEREALHDCLQTVGLDLLIEIGITKRTKADGGWRDDDKDSRKTQRTRLFVLRRDGTIDGAEGRVGTWAPFGG